MDFIKQLVTLQISNYSDDEALLKLIFPQLTKKLSRDRSATILMAAIACYAADGIEKTTYEAIARRAQVSRPLLFKYFADYDEIFYQAMNLIRLHFQRYTLSATEREASPTRKLGAYLSSAFDWMELHPDFAKGHLLYLQRCSRSQRERDLNSQVTENSRQRISALIRTSTERQGFEVRDLNLTAQRIQSVLTGAMMTLQTENIEDEMTFRADTLAVCQSFVRVKPVTYEV